MRAPAGIFCPTEAWRSINELYLYAQERLPRASKARQRDAILSTLVERVQMIAGLLAGTMSHGPAYQYMRLGRNLERADMTTRVIDVAAAVLLSDRPELSRFDNTLWMAVLRCLSGYQAYRQYVRRRVNRNDVIRFLLRTRISRARSAIVWLSCRLRWSSCRSRKCRCSGPRTCLRASAPWMSRPPRFMTCMN